MFKGSYTINSFALQSTKNQVYLHCIFPRIFTYVKTTDHHRDFTDSWGVVLARRKKIRFRKNIAYHRHHFRLCGLSADERIDPPANPATPYRQQLTKPYANRID